MDKNEFQQDKTIDPGQLDVECVRQAELYFKWSERAIEAHAEVDRAKLKLDITVAKLENECRRSPADFGVTKVTEGSVTAAIKDTEKYQEAFDNFYNARSNAKLLDAAVNAMEQRKRMIEMLITLHGQQYFAGPSVPRDLVGEWKKHQQAVEKSVNQSQRKRTRRRGERK